MFSVLMKTNDRRVSFLFLHQNRRLLQEKGQTQTLNCGNDDGGGRGGGANERLKKEEEEEVSQIRSIQIAV